MAASTSNVNTNLINEMAISKAEYLKRYLSADGDGKKSKGNKVKKRRVKTTGKGMRIVDDDFDWKREIAIEAKGEEVEEEEEAPVIAEVIDERPDDVKVLEAFRSSSRWRVMGANEEEDGREEEGEHGASLDARKTRHDSPEHTSGRKTRHDSPDNSPPRRARHDSPDASPPRRARYDSPDASPPRRARHDSPDASPPRRARHDSPEVSPSRRQKPDSDQSPARRRAQNKPGSDSDQSPVRRRAQNKPGSDSDQSPRRKRPHGGGASDSDQSPPRRRQKPGNDSDSDLSPPRNPDQSQAPRMLSGGASGLVSIDVLRREQEDNRRREKHNQPLEDQSRDAQTIFRDKSGKRRDLEVEREEQRRKAGEKAEKDEKYAQWGKGLVQGEMQRQNLEDAVRESQKPLARRRDDEDLDRMLREREREGDPMAAMMRRKKERHAQIRGVKEKPRYKGPLPPPNRFNLAPGYRWDGVDRSNGFEQKRYSRLADNKAVQDMAYKWSVEDM